MFLYDNKLWQEDLNTVITTLPDLNALSNKSILITGAAGLIGIGIWGLTPMWYTFRQLNVNKYTF